MSAAVMVVAGLAWPDSTTPIIWIAGACAGTSIAAIAALLSRRQRSGELVAGSGPIDNEIAACIGVMAILLVTYTSLGLLTANAIR